MNSQAAYVRCKQCTVSVYIQCVRGICHPHEYISEGSYLLLYIVITILFVFALESDDLL